jgi:two-component system OmpR family response regulator
VRILVVEDEAALAAQLETALTAAGYAVDRAASGDRADYLARTEDYDAVLLDLGLPRVDGLTLLRQWRDAGMAVPVLVLTARGTWSEKVHGIDSGADDYVAKPFRLAELMARIRALLRRRAHSSLEANGVRIDFAARRVQVDGREVQLANKEVELLRVLMEGAGQGVCARHAEEQSISDLQIVVDVLHLEGQAAQGDISPPGVGGRPAGHADLDLTLQGGAGMLAPLIGRGVIGVRGNLLCHVPPLKPIE